MFRLATNCDRKGLLAQLLSKKLFGNSQSTAVAPELRPCVTVTARVISGVASHIQVEETEALHVSRIALM
ncbi:MAG: hypothetical protein BECKG1743D_GA0114223_103575, partial [Candidatus Kentron sp. G]